METLAFYEGLKILQNEGQMPCSDKSERWTLGKGKKPQLQENSKFSD